MPNTKSPQEIRREERKKLLDACSEHLKPIVIVALNTGMRRGEILNLKWNDIDFKRSIIYLLDTKNSEKREIPMNQIVNDNLSRVTKHPSIPYVFYEKNGKFLVNMRKSSFTALKKPDII